MKNLQVISMAAILATLFAANAFAVCPSFNEEDVREFRQALKSATFVSKEIMKTSDDKYGLTYKAKTYFMPADQYYYLMQKDVSKWAQVDIEAIKLVREETLSNRVQCHYEAVLQSPYAPSIEISPYHFRMTHVTKR